MKMIEPIRITDQNSFSRASTARFYAIDGRVGTAAVNEPRLHYTPEVRIYAPAGWLAGPSLLLPTIPLPGMTVVPAMVPRFLAEAAATNVMLQSQDLTTWTAAEATVTANFSVAPDGTETSEKIVPSTTDTPAHQVSKMAAAVVAAGGPVAGSIFLRSSGFPLARLRLATTGQAAGVEMTVDLDDGDIPYAGAFGDGASFGEARIIQLGAGWWRLEIEGAVEGATTFGLFVTVGDGVDSLEGDGIAGIEAWGAQIEAGAVSSYIPTTTAAATRSADVGTPMLVSNVAEDEAVYNPATTYAANAVVRGNTPETAHTIYISLKAANVGKALTSTEWWLAAGGTNRWRMFDEVAGSQTVNPDTITVVLTSPKRVTALALLNIDAASARVTMTDAVDGVVYDKIFSLISTAGINNWWSWLFNDIERTTQKLALDLPPYSKAQLTITLSNPGYSVKCGACVIGKLIVVGKTQYGASPGIVDYSTKGRDAFGNPIIVQRPFSRRTQLPVRVPNSFVDRLIDLLAGYRATPIVYIGSELFGSTVIYGYYKDFSTVIAYPTESDLSIELESLV